MNVPYVGNSTLCFTNSLAMCLKHANQTTIPEVGFIECTTLMPFGSMFLDLGDTPLFFPNPPNTNPDKGVTDAISSLGWECEIWRGEDSDLALTQLLEALKYSPVLLGPLDMGHLSYDPHAKAKFGGDHYIVALSVEGNQIVVHDPQLYPYATIPTKNLLQALDGLRLGYVKNKYTMRFGFQLQQQKSRLEMIEQTLEKARSFVQHASNGPVLFGGKSAFERTASAISGGEMHASKGLLTHFSFPIGTRRSLDAAAFVAEQGASELSASFHQRGKHFGRAQFYATQGDWEVVTGILEELALLEDHLQGLMLEAPLIH
jgi:hypothetical protein